MRSVTLSDLKDKKQRGSNSIYKFAWRVISMPVIEGVAEPVKGKFEMPLLNVEGVTLPMPSQSVTEATVSATSVFFADKHEIDKVNLIVKEDEFLSSLQYFTAWNHNIQNPYTGGFYLPKRYKREIRVALFNSQGEPVMEAYLKGVWPNTIQEMELDNSDSKHKINVSCSVDAVIPTFLHKVGK